MSFLNIATSPRFRMSPPEQALVMGLYKYTRHITRSIFSTSSLFKAEWPFL